MAAVTPEIVGRNFEVTLDIRQLVESKLGRVEDRLFDDVISVRMIGGGGVPQHLRDPHRRQGDDVKAVQE